MGITLHNYESYFIDFHDGRLSAADKSELMGFLDAHPDLKSELDDFDAIKLEPENHITYNDKSSLRRSMETNVTEEDALMISLLENDISIEEKQATESNICKNPNPARLLSAYKNTVSSPDLTVKFPEPESLKKKTGIVLLFSSGARYAAAAIIILLISISGWFLFNTGSVTENHKEYLSTLERIPCNKILIAGGEVLMTERPTESMNNAYPLREQISLNRMSGTDGLSVKPSSALVYSSNFLLPRQIEQMPYQNAIDGSYELAMHEPGKKTLMGNVISGIFGRVKAPFNSNREASTEKTSESFSLWNIAELGVKGVNALGDHDYTVVRDYNEKGNVTGFIVLEE